jgi:hypothetical protein
MQLRQDFFQPTGYFGRLAARIGLKIGRRLQGFTVILLHVFMFHQKAHFHRSIQKLQRNASLASSPILGHALGKESSTPRDPSKLWRLSRRHLAKYFAPP